ncbi:pyocin activator PrtN family protein [Acinetobacter sp. UBA1297]|uniref:pyocin activator PrtN family protein n=1 Tax=Acinetobacter sp. UBA1297 TaxID=1945925 RepID=UPI00257A31CD|nr:pyocin activator PrtN family protein [Acinetobacter sp. UBA1297]
MNKVQMNLSDYLFMQFKTMTPTLEQVAAMYYPHLSKAKILEKARKKEFPFICYKIDESQKSPYLVDIFDLAFVLDKRYNEQAKEYEIFTKSALMKSQN